jgi:hypothetical protein
VPLIQTGPRKRVPLIQLLLWLIDDP